jgi:hypothetical protein
MTREVPGAKIFSKRNLPGRLFIVEGIDGSGKSTQLALLQKWLESEGYGTFFSEWNSSALVSGVTRRGKKKRMLTPMTFSLIHATDFADRHRHDALGAGWQRVEGGERRAHARRDDDESLLRHRLR